MTFPDLIKSHLSQRVRGKRGRSFELGKKKVGARKQKEMREAALMYVCVCIHKQTHTHTQTSWGLSRHDPSDLPCLECLNTVLHQVPQMSIKYKRKRKRKRQEREQAAAAKV